MLGAGPDGARSWADPGPAAGPVARWPGGWWCARRPSAISRTSRCGSCALSTRRTCSPARTPATRGAARPPRDRARGRLVSLHEHNERQRTPSWWSGSRRRGGRAGERRRDAGCPIPGSCWSSACHEAGLAVEVLPGPSAVVTALVASGLPAEAGGSPAFCRGERGELERELRGRRHAGGVRVAPAAAGDARACWPRSTRSGRSAVCRELTKVHEEVVRGTAAELAQRFAEGTGVRWCW